jgi:acyl-[acyl-carrier-protein]-phospholipid O-acyltransferase / long-chain-fatty-acid--[acyl-carrier-protein] ligase
MELKMIDDNRLHPAFKWFNATQFMGAMNDNILKLLIIFSLINSRGSEKAGIVTAAVGAAFVLPFLIFSAPAGCLADRFRKSQVIVAVKIMEVIVTALAVAAFAFGWDNSLYLIIFLMAAHSAFFAPAKYGVIPELSGPGQLSRTNGLVESFTFLAIIFGTALASVLPQLASGRYWVASIACLLVALAGLWAAWQMPTTQLADPGRKISLLPAELYRTTKLIRKQPRLTLAVIGLAYFWFVAAFAQLNLIGYGIQHLGLTQEQSGYLFLAAAFGIGIGSLLAARISGQSVELGLVPVGAFGLVLAQLLLLTAPANLAIITAVIMLFGISAGFFSLPFQTYIQFGAEASMRGEVLAVSSFTNWIGILLASAATFLVSATFKLSAAQGFAVIGVLTLVVTLLTLRLMPDFRQQFNRLLNRRHVK